MTTNKYCCLLSDTSPFFFKAPYFIFFCSYFSNFRLFKNWTIQRRSNNPHWLGVRRKKSSLSNTKFDHLKQLTYMLDYKRNKKQLKFYCLTSNNFFIVYVFLFLQCKIGNLKLKTTIIPVYTDKDIAN